MKEWLSEQIRDNTEHWGEAIARHYPQYVAEWSEPETHVFNLMNEWNYLEAWEFIDWSAISSKQGMSVIDLGCGAGWVSAKLSQLGSVEHIFAIDSDLKLLNQMVPPVTELLHGDISKIEAVHGLFSPLLLPDNSVDLIVSSSAFHHAEDLFALVRECFRVLEPGGKLVILNETPKGYWAWQKTVLRNATRVLLGSLFRSGGEYETKLSRTGLLYDPYLGDIVSPYWHWKKAFESAGFEHLSVQTGLPTYKNKVDKSRLVHFICTKPSE